MNELDTIEFNNEDGGCFEARLDYAPEIFGYSRSQQDLGNIGNIDPVLLLSLCNSEYDAVRDIKKINFYKRAGCQLAAATCLPVLNAISAVTSFFDGLDDDPERSPEFIYYGKQTISGPICHSLGLLETIFCLPCIKYHIAKNDNGFQQLEMNEYSGPLRQIIENTNSESMDINTRSV